MGWTEKIDLVAFPTPSYVYNLRSIEGNIDRLKSIFCDKIRVNYSVKANPNFSIVEFLNKQNCSFDCASIGEVNVCLSAGVLPLNILITSPAKTNAELLHFSRNGIRKYSCESEHDLINILAAHKDVEGALSVYLRIDMSLDLKSARISMGKGTHFGMLAEEAVRILGKYKRSHNCKFEGLHFYIGTQIEDVSNTETYIRSALQTLQHIEDVSAHTFDSIDIGPGLPSAYGKVGSENTIALHEDTRSLLCDLAEKKNLIIEVGRFLVSSSGVFLTRILEIREKYDNKYLIIDGGINCLGGMSGLGRILPERFDFSLVKQLKLNDNYEDRLELYRIVGPLCTSLDNMAFNSPLSNPVVGDVLMVPNVGAYGFTASLNNFLLKNNCTEHIIYE